MKKVLLATAVAALAAGSVAAQESPWLVRARAVNLVMENKVDGTLADLNVNVNNKVIPEVDVSYFFNKNVAAELILTVPQNQTVFSGTTSLGTFMHLPPTLTLQYHFTDLGNFKPYVGAGVNYTNITNGNVQFGGQHLTLDGHSTGLAYQVGVDYKLDKNWSINVDYKKVGIKTDVMLGATNLGTLKLNPGLVGVGVGYRF